MITNFKKFEEMNYNEYPEIDDFISIHIQSSNKEFEKFVNNTIGKVIDVIDITNVFDEPYDKEVIVGYNDVPYKLYPWFMNSSMSNSYNSGWKYEIGCESDHKYKRRFMMHEVSSFGKTIEDLEARKQAKKYNL